MNIPDLAVEAATRTFYGTALDDVSDEDMQYALDLMRESLEAAMPFLLKETL